MYIDGNMIVEYIQKTGNGFSWTTLIAPVLTSVIGIITVYKHKKSAEENNETMLKIAHENIASMEKIESDNHKVSKELSEKQNKFIKEMKNKELNANIIAQSRINWLQEVRNINVEFIKGCYDLIGDKMKNGTMGKSDRITKFDNEFWRLYYTLVLLYPTKGEGDNPEKDNEDNKKVIVKASLIRDMIFMDSGKNSMSKIEYYKSIEIAIEEYANTVSNYSKREWQKIKEL